MVQRLLTRVGDVPRRRVGVGRGASERGRDARVHSRGRAELPHHPQGSVEQSRSDHRVRRRPQQLRPAGRERERRAPITLAESIALALEHNTGLRIAALNPIAATNQVRKAYSQFDPGALRRHLEAAQRTRRRRRSARSPPTISDPNEDQPDDVEAPSLFSNVVDWNAGVRKRSADRRRVSAQWGTPPHRRTRPSSIWSIPSYVTALGVSAQPAAAARLRLALRAAGRRRRRRSARSRRIRSTRAQVSPG